MCHILSLSGRLVWCGKQFLVRKDDPIPVADRGDEGGVMWHKKAAVQNRCKHLIDGTHVIILFQFTKYQFCNIFGRSVRANPMDRHCKKIIM
mmetsp:Transcript_15414/g.44698  ORF Transcript_15414/g.44698 Transcript_15414/m.44698 type:complete len:92 (+) Transcript_15414:342-617(+)